MPCVAGLGQRKAAGPLNPKAGLNERPAKAALFGASPPSICPHNENRIVWGTQLSKNPDYTKNPSMSDNA